MSPAATRRAGLVAALALGLGAMGFVVFGGLGKNLVYYWSPSELVANSAQAKEATVRLGGVVVAGSIAWEPGSGGLTFRLTDGEQEVPVHVTGAPPQMFREGIGVLVEGHVGEGGVFESDRLMVKHSNEYRAPKEGEPTADLYRTVDTIESGAATP
ncbi:MAG: cytochrome c maturation protein CcmE [Myxococcota bacterium]